MAYYLDASAFLKLVVEEDHSVAMTAWMEDHEDDLISSDLLFTETLRAARRLGTDALREVRRRIDGLTLIRLTPDIFQRAADLDPAIMRSLDALHLSAALSLSDELDGLVTYDERLAGAAALHGVETLAPTVPPTA